MEKCSFRVAIPQSLVTQTQELAAEHHGICSEPQPASSTAEPLNAPISGGDIQAAASVLTVVFTAGTAGAKFIEALFKLAEARRARIKASNVEKKVTRVLESPQDVEDLSPK